jgi:hypothetical protein
MRPIILQFAGTSESERLNSGKTSLGGDADETVQIAFESAPCIWTLRKIDVIWTDIPARKMA